MSPRRSIFSNSTAARCSATATDHPVVKNPGEKGKLVYIPLGVGVVIPPWNFPLAILAGMTSAAVVTGNTVVLKPSSDSPADRLEVLGGHGEGRASPPASSTS